MRYSCYRFLLESLDSKFDTIRNEKLESEVNSTHPDRIFTAHTKAMQSSHMKTVGLSVLRFMGKPLKQIEYHIHNEHAAPGVVTTPDRKAMMHALKIIHTDASDQIKTHHRSIYIHAANKEQYDKYLPLGHRLAKEHNVRVKEIGNQPYTTDHSRSGPAFIVREQSEYVDLSGKKFIHIDEQLILYNSKL